MILWAMGSTAAWAQAPAWQTATTVGVGPNNAGSVRATATDAVGNVYLVGTFNAVASFGSTTLTSNGGYDAFVAKWSPVTGTFVWALNMGGIYVDGATAVAVSGTSVYVAGNFQGTGTFGGNSLTSAGGYNGFVTKLTDLGASASFGWTQQVVGSGNDQLFGMAVRTNSVFVTGWFTGSTVSLGSITLANSSATSAGSANNGYVAKLLDAGTSGSFAWAYDISSPNRSTGYQVAVSGTSVYLTGYFDTAATFGTIAKTSAGGFDAFLAKLVDGGPTASFSWVQAAGGPGNDSAYGVTAAGTAVYLTGTFEATAAFGTTALTSTGGQDGFMLKCTDAGASSTLGWVQQLGGAGGIQVLGAVAISPNIYLVGRFDGTCSVGTTNLTAAGGNDIFVAKLTDGGPTGSVAWAQRAGGAGSDVANSLTIQSSGSVYVGGFATPPATFGSLALSGVAGTSTGFLASLTDPTLTATTPPLQPESIGLSPNPAHGRATIQLPLIPGAATATLTLLDALGRPLRTLAVPTNAKAELDLAGLPAGIYAVLVQAGGSTATRRLVVE